MRQVNPIVTRLYIRKKYLNASNSVYLSSTVHLISDRYFKMFLNC